MERRRNKNEENDKEKKIHSLHPVWCSGNQHWVKDYF